jgi:hypothetical protein
MVLTCFAAVALSTNEDTLLDFPWAHAHGMLEKPNQFGDHDEVYGDMYVGLSGVLTDVTTVNLKTGTTSDKKFEGFFAWSKKDKDCSSNYCKGCKEASEANLTTVLIGLILAIPTLMSDLTRTSDANDTNLEKVIGIMGGLFGGVSDMLGLISFMFSCATTLPEHIKSKHEGKMMEVAVKWQVGVGLYCMMFATGILFMDGLVHLLVPAPRHRTKGGGWDSDEDDEFLKDSSSDSEDEEQGACKPLLSCGAKDLPEQKEKEGPCKEGPCCN